jgi:hypothetical protein
LLIGGPGQGKSTLGQLACQLNRAALLAPYLDELTSSEKEMVRSFLNADFGGKPTIRAPENPSLPLQIALPDFAGWLSKHHGSGAAAGTAPALLRFLTEMPSAKNSGLTSDHLFTLACHLPVLLVLDGFDEVGASLDRERLVIEARTLLEQLGRANAVCHLLATTRPQGYAGELSRIGIPLRNFYLSPLRKDEALSYASKLVSAKIPGIDNQRKALERLKEAAREPATQRLLSTPLQVTILTALVQHIGRAPRERWNLFSRYFAYTYDREIERETYASRILAEHRGHIEQIHARVALLLQVDAERDGGGAAKMSRADLEKVIVSVLAEDEVAETERTELVREIAKAAEERLVFLVEPEPGCYGFEIRSLQEFMAAWALTAGRDADVEARLQQVMRASMFKNVALFIESRLYSEASPQRDAIPLLFDAWDEDSNDASSRVVRAGASFALETLEEGAVLAQPKRARAVMERATRLLALPPSAEHIRLARVSTSDTVPVLRGAIEEALIEARNSGKQCTALTLLVDAANRNETWAAELVDQYWSEFLKDDSWLTWNHTLGIELQDWLALRLTESSGRFRPERFVYLSRSPSCDSSSSWASWLNFVLSDTERLRGRANIFGLIDVMPEGKRMAVEPSEPVPDAWRHWVAAARFELASTHDRLADTLAELSQAWDFVELDQFRWRCSWPLSVSLAWARSAQDLAHAADLARSGALGTAEEWMERQKGWPEKMDLIQMIQKAPLRAPWSMESIEIGPPLVGLHSWILADMSSHRWRSSPSSSYRLVVTKFDAASGALKTKLAETCLSIARSKSQTRPVATRADLEQFVRAAPQSGPFLVARPRNIDVSEWCALLDQSETPGTLFSLEQLDRILDAFVRSSGHPVLLRLAVLHAEFAAKHSWRHDPVSESVLKSLKATLKAYELSSSQVAADVLCLKAWLGMLSETKSSEIIEHLRAAALTDTSVVERFITLLDRRTTEHNLLEALCVGILETFSGDHGTTAAVVEKLREVLQGRTSGLSSVVVWRRLGLPEPTPQEVADDQLTRWIPSEPIHFSAIELRNIAGLKELRLDLAPPEQGVGQWIVLLGPNGSGKTTLLRSVVLALRNTKDPAIWPKGAFSVRWRRIAADSSETVGESRISVELKGGHVQTAAVTESGSTLISQHPDLHRPRLFPLFAYGCRRGSALGGAIRQVDLTDDDGPEVATLFDEGASLIHAETWLLQLDGDAQRSTRTQRVLAAVTESLCTFLQLESITFEDRRVWVKEKGKPRLPFASLSDGYLTAAGWLLDLTARWIDFCDRAGLEVHHDFMRDMVGLVVVDEIDLHLHPKWQVEIIDRTRRLMPKMSFLVSTHNPLTLVGARAEEVWKLSSSADGVIGTAGSVAPLLLTGGQLYKQYFGIDDIYPDEVGRKLQRLSFLSGYSLRSDQEQEELNSLVEELGQLGVTPGWEPVDRVNPSFGAAGS